MMIIRAASGTDLDQLSVLFDQYRQFYEQSSDIEAARLFIQERMTLKESQIFVATSSQKPQVLLGFVQLYPSFTSVGMKRTWILNDLFVDKQARAQGVGEALIQAATAFSRDSGVRNLVLQTAVTNIQAQKLYEKLGWTKNERFFTYNLFH